MDQLNPLAQLQSANDTSNALTAGMVLQLADGTIAACNAAAKEILGGSLEQIQTWTSSHAVWRMIRADGRNFSAETHPARVTLSTGTPQSGVVMGLAQADSLRWVVIDTQPLFQTSSVPYAVVITFKPIASPQINPELQNQPERLSYAVPAREINLHQENNLRLELAQQVSNAGFFDWYVKEGTAFVTGFLRCILPAATETGVVSLQDWISIVHAEDNTRVQNLIQTAFAAHETQLQYDFRVQTLEGERWLNARAEVQYDETGQPYRVIGINSDITHRKQMEEALRQSESRFRRLSDSNLIGILFWDWEGDILDANDAFLQMLGFTQEDLAAGIRWTDLTPPEWSAIDQQGAEQILATGTAGPFEKEYFHKNGSRVPVLLGSAFLEGSRQQGVSFVLNLSERKCAEAALRDKEQQLQQLSDSMPQFVWMFSATGQLEYVNRQWIDYSGLTLEETRDSERVAKFHHPEDWPLVMEQWAIAIETSQQFEVEARLKRVADGAYRWFLLRAVPGFDQQGQMVRWYGTSTDIHERKQAQLNEQFLSDLDLRLRQLDSVAEVVVNATRRLGEYLKVDYCHFFEIDPADADRLRIYQDWSGNGISLAGNYRFSELTQPGLKAMLQRGQVVAVVDVRTDPLTAAYADRYPSLNVQAFAIAPCQLAGELVGGLAVDSAMSRQWRADELELLQEMVVRVWSLIQQMQSIEALRQSEWRFRSQSLLFEALMSSIQDYVYVFNPSGQFVYANQQLLNLWGMTAEQAVGKTMHDLAYPAEVETQLLLNIDTVLQTQKPTRSETCYTSPTGVTGYFDNIMAPVFDERGEVELIAGTSRDITIQKQAEQNQQRLLEAEQAARLEAERTNRMKDEFLAILSHELRSPLNPILGWTRLMQSGHFGSEKMAEALAIIERNARLQIQLIDDLLDTARILRGKLSLTVAPVDLAFVIESAIDTVRIAATAKSIQLNSTLPQIGQVSGDATRLQQVVWNLLSNAVKFTPSGGSITIQLKQIENEAEITVQDTGKGIDPEFLPYLFESFRQEDSSISRKYGGLGLGLAIVRHLVEAHGGRIWATSSGEGQGATFTVRLPLLRVDLLPLPSPLSPDQKPDLTGIRVLAIDDEPDARELLTAILTQYNADVFVVATAEAAMSALGTFQPNVLVSDIGMPDINGYALLQQIRALPPQKGGQTPAIALTAYAREEDRQASLAAGFQRHLAKPLDPLLLVQLILDLTKR